MMLISPLCSHVSSTWCMGHSDRLSFCADVLALFFGLYTVVSETVNLPGSGQATNAVSLYYSNFSKTSVSTLLSAVRTWMFEQSP